MKTSRRARPQDKTSGTVLHTNLTLIEVADPLLLEELRARQLTPAGRAALRERVQVEHSLAHIGAWQGDRARYRGWRKNLFDLRRTAVVHNLHVLQRLPDVGDVPQAA